uniref:Tandem C2 domains, nuclear n=1 Tax=Nothobranchius furzeri TaxID=105023 RepID=A0A8C6NMR3_NOTFU
AVMEFFKKCCKKLMQKDEKEQETHQVITFKTPPTKITSEDQPFESEKEVTEDYLLSKMPPDGREVPFVVPTFKASYVQPRDLHHPHLQPGLKGSARSTYAERKSELLGTTYFTYSPESSFHQGHMSAYVSPGSTRRDTLKKGNSSPQRQDSVTLSGDEHELGKVCVRLSYQEDLEQVWITLVQCSDLNLHPEEAEQQRFGFKGIITIPKPIQFKSSVKELSQDVSIMETFVFALRLQQLHCSALVLRLQTHRPRKRTVAECVLSLRQLGPEESEHWLDLNPPSKSSVGLCHSELHISTCFQPVSGRIQLKALAAQNLPPSSSPLSQGRSFFVKAELHQLGLVVMKRKTRALKASGGQCQWEETFHFLLSSLEHPCSLSARLYSRSSVRRKQCLGQVQLSFDSSIPEALEQWKDTMAHPEKVVTSWHRLSPP